MSAKKENYDYRTAMEGALDVKEVASILHCIKYEKPHGDIRTAIERLSHFGIYDEGYENQISRLRNLVEDCYQYMTLNTFKQKVPRSIIEHFKETMENAAALVRKNKYDREDDLDRGN